MDLVRNYFGLYILNYHTLRHYNYNHGQMFGRIINGEDVFKTPVFEPLDGVALKSFLVIGQRRMQKLIKFFKLRGIKLPSIKRIQEAEKKIMVPFQTTEDAGLRIPLRTIMERNCIETIEHQSNLKPDEIPEKLFVEGCCGFDGSGKTHLKF